MLVYLLYHRMDDVVDSDNDHQSEQEGHANKVDEAFAFWFEPFASAHQFDEDKHNTPTIQRGEGQDVDDGEVEAQDGRETENRPPPLLRDSLSNLTSDLDDADRANDLGLDGSDNHLPYPIEKLAGDVVS